jgi:hypothetical protein
MTRNIIQSSILALHCTANTASSSSDKGFGLRSGMCLVQTPCSSYTFIHSFIPLPYAECNDFLPFSGASSIPLCYICVPAKKERNKEHSVHLVGLELNIYVTKMYGTTNIKFIIL